MPDLTVVVTGTGTGVGKTWFTTRVVESLRDFGVAVAVRKPVQTFDPEEGPTDRDLLAEATGEPPDVVCPPHRSFEVPMAPPMAADALGRPPFTTVDLIEELSLPSSGIALIEGVGGPRSPIAHNGDTVTLAERIGCHLVLLVADAGLGTINSTLLCIEALKDFSVLVALNRFDPQSELHVRNLEWLRRAGLDVVISPAEAAAQIWERSRPRAGAQVR